METNPAKVQCLFCGSGKVSKNGHNKTGKQILIVGTANVPTIILLKHILIMPINRNTHANVENGRRVHRNEVHRTYARYI